MIYKIFYRFVIIKIQKGLAPIETEKKELLCSNSCVLPNASTNVVHLRRIFVFAR